MAALVAALAGACDTPDVRDGASDAAPSGCGLTCDDGDPCTEDRCVADACVHVPRDANDACRDDDHCDDGDPCTVDTCALDACGLERCRHTLASPTCRRCTSVYDCLDDDLCTTDRCTGGACVNASIPDCLSGCDPRAIVAMNRVTEGPVTLRGRAREVIHPCDAGPGCACSFALGLYDGARDVPLTRGDSFEACVGSPCPALSPSCFFLDLGREYLLWGEARPSALAPPRPVVDVAGWCVAPSAAGFKGWDEAMLTLDGDPTPIALELRADGDGRVVIPAADGVDEQVTQLGLNGPTTTVVQLTLTARGQALDARLYPGPDGFAGPVAALAHPDDTQLWDPGPPIGRLVVRVRPTPPPHTRDWP